jgi:small subunit ribosomal protein S3
MEERKIVKLKKEEYAIKDYIKHQIGKGKVSRVSIEYTPVGEKVILSTHKPGLIIGRKGERIEELTTALKTKFKMENPHVEIDEIKEPYFDSQVMADDIAMQLERFGPMKFKVIAYRTLQKIIEAGALGVDIRLNGKLPSSRAKQWRFAQGYLKKTGDPVKLISRSQARAETKPGTVGIKVAILSPHVVMKDRIKITPELLESLKDNSQKESKKSKKEINK